MKWSGKFGQRDKVYAKYQDNNNFELSHLPCWMQNLGEFLKVNVFRSPLRMAVQNL